MESERVFEKALKRRKKGFTSKESELRMLNIRDNEDMICLIMKNR